MADFRFLLRLPSEIQKEMIKGLAVPAEIPAKMAEAIPAVTAAEVLKAEATPAAAVLPRRSRKRNWKL